MDRPSNIARLRLDGCGVRTVGSRDPESLSRLSDKVFSDAHAIDGQAFVSGMHLGGGGGGADWQVSYTLLHSVGLGFAGTSCWAGKAHALFREASDASEIDRAVEWLLRQIGDVFPTYPDANIYDLQVAGAGPDGPYLVGLLWGEYSDPPPLVTNQVDGEQGPFDTETLVAGAIRSRPTPDALDQSTFLLHWGCIFQETGNAGIFIRLQFSVGFSPAAPWTTIREVTCTAGVADWRGCGGVANVFQPVYPTGESVWYRLAVAANPPTTITVRNTYLHLLRVGNNNELS